MDATYLVVGILALLALGFVLFTVARRMRGSIEISLPKTAFEPGETIAGSFVLHAKKPIEARQLVVSLTASEVTRTNEGGKTRSRTTRVFRDERVLEGEKSYPADTKETHEFEIDVPDVERPEALDSPLLKSLAGATRALSRSRSRLRWRLEVRLAARGIDLVASREVSVNIRHL